MTITTTAPAPALARVTFVELEITGKCQLKCTHCCTDSGPDSTHGTMTTDDWRRVIVEAARYGVRTVQFIGGEPTMHPDLLPLIRHALAQGLKVDVFTNLVHITEEMWATFGLAGVSLGTSWYAADAKTHAQITGTEGSYRRTRDNIAKAVRREIPVHAGIVKVIDGQDIEAAKAELLLLGVTSMNVDEARSVGRAANGRLTTVQDLCGRCGDGRAAVMPDGSFTPCLLGRHLVAGNVKNESIAEILDGGLWAAIMESIPNRGSCITCTPADSNDCNPAKAIQ